MTIEMSVYRIASTSNARAVARNLAPTAQSAAAYRSIATVKDQKGCRRRPEHYTVSGTQRV
jgi:hypothetical protein